MARGHGGPRPGSGRKPGKVSAAKLDIAERAKSHGEAALLTLADIMADPEAPHNARVSAANALLDRGFGRPMQALEMSGKDGGPIQHEEVARDADAFAGRMAGLAARSAGEGDGQTDDSAESSAEL